MARPPAINLPAFTCRSRQCSPSHTGAFTPKRYPLHWERCALTTAAGLVTSEKCCSNQHDETFDETDEGCLYYDVDGDGVLAEDEIRGEDRNDDEALTEDELTVYTPPVAGVRVAAAHRRGRPAP